MENRESWPLVKHSGFDANIYLTCPPRTPVKTTSCTDGVKNLGPASQEQRGFRCKTSLAGSLSGRENKQTWPLRGKLQVEGAELRTKPSKKRIGQDGLEREQ